MIKMYIKKSDRALFRELDNHLILPKDFNNFIEKIIKKHNLIIQKGSNIYYCTNCKSRFEMKNIKVNDTCKCPNCKMKYTVKKSILKHFDFGDSIGILDKYKDYYIIRYFEVASVYDGDGFKSDVCEYGRKIFNNYFSELHEIINDHVFTGIGCCSVRHDSYIYNDNWRYFGSYWKSLGDNLIFYPGNIKKVLNGTRYQYSQLWTLAKHKEYFNLSQLLHLYDESYEFLIKLKLYNLVGSHDFSCKGTFKKRFGVDKAFLSFMQKYDIDYDELIVLRYYQKKNIDTVRYFKNVMLDTMIKYKVDLDKLITLTDFNPDKTFEYSDYLRFADKLKFNMKDKKILYPKNIYQEHDKLLAKIETIKNSEFDDKIFKRFQELKKNVYKTKKYIIFPAVSIESMIDESRQQNNCVRDYGERYATGECDIYFMRLLETPSKSLVTVEVRDNKVIQQRIKDNEVTTNNQQQFLKVWEKKLNGKDGD